MTDTESAYPRTAAPPSAWVGMVLFAGVVLLMLGGFEMIEGFVALLRDDFYLTTADGLAIPVSFTAWGWAQLIIGTITVATGVGVLFGQMWARVLAIVMGVFGALANMMFLPANPFWGTIVIALNVLCVYAIAAHGREIRA
jgi:hypothetical protein